MGSLKEVLHSSGRLEEGGGYNTASWPATPIPDLLCIMLMSTLLVEMGGGGM